MKKQFALSFVFVALTASCLIVIQPIRAVSQAPQVQWSQTYRAGTTSAIRSMVRTSDGGYALSGLFMYVTLGEVGSWLVKTDSSGNEQWHRSTRALETDFCGSDERRRIRVNWQRLFS